MLISSRREAAFGRAQQPSFFFRLAGCGELPAGESTGGATRLGGSGVLGTMALPAAVREEPPKCFAIAARRAKSIWSFADAPAEGAAGKRMDAFHASSPPARR